MIKVSETISINPKDFKLHLATPSPDGTNPLNVFVRNKKEWEGWQSYRGSKNEWTRKYIFTLIKFGNNWLFGGIFEVIKRHSDHYDVQLTSSFEDFIGRLVVSGIPSRRGQGRSFNLETYFNKFIVNQILQDVYDGQNFPGYENINITFQSLEHIYRINKTDWNSALKNLKGVYLITDIKTNKRYVGSASGDQGIWQRWGSYISNGHGGNKLLKKLIKEEGFDYAKKYYRFSLLEFRGMKTDDKEIINRESFWKKVLNTKGDYGYNEN